MTDPHIGTHLTVLCPDCDVMALVRTSERIRCANCGLVISQDRLAELAYLQTQADREISEYDARRPRDTPENEA